MTNSAPLRYIDRARGTIETEKVFGREMLESLYQRAGGRLFRRLIGRHPVASELYGRWKRSKSDPAALRHFVESLDIDAGEAEKPLSAYKNLDEFFIRRLCRSARPIDPDPANLLAPGDGRLLAFAAIREQQFAVKASRVDTATLLGSRTRAQRFRDGAALVLRLAPADYHRFHFPAAGMVSRAHAIRGPLESVHPIALDAGAPSFRNKRTVTILESAVFGSIAIIAVGALAVGTIVHTHTPGSVAAGAEHGYFRFGGSTVVLLFQAGRIEVDQDLLDATRGGLETLVKMGTRVARRIARHPRE